MVWAEMFVIKIRALAPLFETYFRIDSVFGFVQQFCFVVCLCTFMSASCFSFRLILLFVSLAVASPMLLVPGCFPLKFRVSPLGIRACSHMR